MDYLTTVGIIHLLGVILWVGVLAIFSVQVYEVGRRRNSGNKTYSGKNAATSLPAVVFTGSTGFYFLQQWEIWDRIIAMEFWWVHSMLVAWILLLVVVFFLEPFWHQNIN